MAFLGGELAEVVEDVVGHGEQTKSQNSTTGAVGKAKNNLYPDKGEYEGWRSKADL